MDKSSTPALRSVLKDTTNEPPSKRRKIGQSDVLDEEAVEDENEYEKCVSELKAEWKKGVKTRSRAVVKSLMNKTRNMRRRWIEQDRPMTSDILDRFPCLGNSRQVRLQIVADYITHSDTQFESFPIVIDP